MFYTPSKIQANCTKQSAMNSNLFKNIDSERQRPIRFSARFPDGGKGFRLIALLVLLLLVASCNPSLKITPKAEKGILDLRSWSFSQDGPIDLEGEWAFYWNQLSEHGDLMHQDGFISIPGKWNYLELNEGGAIGAYGYATLKLKILLSEAHSEDLLKIYLHSADIAHSLSITDASGNPAGRPLKSGRVAKSRESYTPLRARDSATLTRSTEYTAVWRIANFDSTIGGARHAPRLGVERQIVKELARARSLQFFNLGILLIMGLYHWILFLLRPQDKAPLWFGGLCFAILLYGVITQNYLDTAFPNAELFELYKKLGWISDCLGIIFTLLFLRSVFPAQVNERILKAMLSINLGFIAFIVVAPFRIYVQASLLLYSLIILMVIWTFWILFKAITKEKSILAWLILMGFIIVILTAINDILLVEGIIFTDHLTQYGISALILFQSIVIAIQNQRTHRDKLLAQKQALINLEKADRLKDDFLANTSHELRTPLTGIIGVAESLLDGATGELSTETRKNLSIIASSGQRLYSLVNDILDFARLKNQDLKLQMDAVDIRKMTEMMLNLVQPLVGEKDVDLVNSIPENIALVKADENRLKQIFLNLLANAIKFTREGRIEVTAVSENGLVTLSFIDTGIGIEADKQERVFETFVQGHSSDSRDYGGTGLGLAITRQLIQLHGSEITLVSEPGKGSRFSFSLPVAKLSAEPDKTTAPSSTLPHILGPVIEEKTVSVKQLEPLDSDIKGKTILVVDDEPVILQVLKNHLQSHAFKVLSTSDGFHALELIEKEKPDLVILDLMMPNMNGYQVLEQLRINHSPSQLPVLVLTAKNRAKDLTRSFNSGANDYLTKPFVKEELLSRIYSHLKLKSFSNRLAESNKLLEELNNSLEGQVLSRTEELNDRNIQLKQLIQVLCHDLLNPLANVESIIRLLKHDAESFDSMLPLLDISIENGLDIIYFVKQMQALEDKHFDLELQAYNLHKLVEEAVTILSKQIEEKNLRLETRVDRDAIVIVEKTSFINSVLNNVLTNAIKFSFNDSLIEVKMTEENGMIALQISDSGIGMPDAIIETVFDLDKPTSRLGTKGEAGTGYGLPLVKKFMAAYEGRIELESTEMQEGVDDHGTIVTLYLKSGDKNLS